MAPIWNTIVPVFAVIAVGFALGRMRSIQARTLADLAVWVTSPALVFSLLADTEVVPDRLLRLGLGTAGIAFGTALLALLYRRATGVGRGFLLPAVFWNGGNMGLACAQLAFGPAGLESAAIPFVGIALLHSLFGIWIAKGENGLREALRLPLLWGALGGVLLAATGTELPRPVMEPIEMLGAMAVPLMLLNLGLQLRALHLTDFGHSSAAVVVRMGGGFACAWLLVGALGIDGVDRGVLLLQGSMPAAVINAVVAQRYGTDPSLVASAIVLGTIASLGVIPLVLLAL